MRYRAFAVAGTLLLSAPALGAAGDVLTVIGDNVNVRSGPGTEHAVQRQVSKLSGWSRSSGKATGCMPRSPIRAVRGLDPCFAGRTERRACGSGGDSRSRAGYGCG